MNISFRCLLDYGKMGITQITRVPNCIPSEENMDHFCDIAHLSYVVHSCAPSRISKTQIMKHLKSTLLFWYCSALLDFFRLTAFLMFYFSFSFGKRRRRECGDSRGGDLVCFEWIERAHDKQPREAARCSVVVNVVDV